MKGSLLGMDYKKHPVSLSSVKHAFLWHFMLFWGKFKLLLLFLCYFSSWAFCLCYFYTFFNYGYDGPVICGYWKLTKLSMSSWQFNSRNWSQALGLIWNMSSAGTRVAPSESRSTHQLLLTFGSDRLLLITSSQPCIWILKTWLLDLQAEYMQKIAHGCQPSSHPKAAIWFNTHTLMLLLLMLLLWIFVDLVLPTSDADLVHVHWHWQWRWLFDEFSPHKCWFWCWFW